MNREDIIRMARKAGMRLDKHDGGFVEASELERFAALVAAAERERIIAANKPEIEKVNTHIKALEEAIAAEREKVAAWMIQHSYATGHGDTTEDLLKELDWQIDERIAAEREACAKVCDADGLLWGKRYAAAIRARGTA